ncbi:MAG TPA: response regulator [Crocinitomicaceae bacterium]|nr:response regulator [Crocinitomicaceae bacterium]
MKKTTYLIIDDERLAREELKSLLKNESDLEFIGEASNAPEAINLIHQEQPDLIFLDIQMPGMNGLDMLKKLEEIPQVIFTTAYDEYAIKAFEINALDYLLKPIDPIRLSDALKKLTTQDDFVSTLPTDDRFPLDANDTIFVKENDKCYFVNLNTVRYFESDGNYVKIYFDKQRPMIVSSLNALESKLSAKHFFRASRKHIVNVSFIQNVENWFNGGLQFTLSTGEKIEVSRRQSIRFKDFFGL